MPYRIFMIFVVLCSMTSGCVTLPQPRPQLEADAQYTRVSDNMQRLVTGGRITQIRWSDDGSSFTYTRDDQRNRYDLASHTISETDREPRDAGERRSGRPRVARGRQRDRIESPCGEWVAICRDWNVVIEPANPPNPDDEAPDVERKFDDSEAEDNEVEMVTVTSDGHRKFRYGVASWVYGEELRQNDAMWWSPDSSKLVFYEFDEREVPDHFLVGGLTELHTTVLTEGYPKPGEANPIANLLIYDLATRATIRVNLPGDPEDEWYTYGIQFSPERDNGSFDLLYFRTNRHQNILHLCAADVNTGESRMILTERQDTWQDNSPTMRFLADGERFIWTSEKTGWKQYELRHIDGSYIATLTHGEFPVSAIVRVDEDNNRLYYTAFSDANPLNAHLHRVNLDGSDSMRLTQEPLNHSITMSPDGDWFVTEYQGVDSPPITALYDTDGNRIATIAESDTTLFDELGMSMPELFTFKADDGVTDLYGVLYKPANFNPRKKYPLVIDVYGGPLSQGVRQRFVPTNAGCEYGFLIAKIDNRGTANRGKAFESATYLRLGEVDIKDQVDGVRHLAQRSYVDASRVGIMGHSYGGYMATLGLLKYPDVFHVAVGGGSVVDWRQYDTIYTERFMRTPQENPDGYDAGSCLSYVDQLEGKLLLLHGMMDDNVHTNNIWQLIDALHKAEKPFEMMLYPTAGHSLGSRATRARWEFLRRHLLN